MSAIKKAASLILSANAFLGAQTVGRNANLTRAKGNQYETAVAVDPKDNDRIFVVSRNEAGGLYTSVSSDGGSTWSSRLIGRGNFPAAGDIPRAYGNPSAAWDEFGNLFLAFLAQGSPAAPTYVALSMSLDGGITFSAPGGAGPVLFLPLAPPAPPLIGDQPTVAVGPGSAGFPGSVWVMYWTVSGLLVSGAGVSGPGVVGSFASFRPDQPVAVSFGDIAVGPAGEVMIAYGPNSGSSGRIYANAKPDGLGPEPFSTYVAVASVNLGGFSPIPAQPDWGIDPEVSLSWDRSQGPHRGRVYLVFTDAPEIGSVDTDIFIVRSDDTGSTWSGRVRVNDDVGSNSQFLPHLSLDQSNGMLAVTWYDARDSVLNNTAKYFGAFVIEGGSIVTPNFPISLGESDAATSPFLTRKADYGDYTGNAFVHGRLVAAWADNSNSTGDNLDGATAFDVYAAIVQCKPALKNRRRVGH